MLKIEVSKERYEQVRQEEKVTGQKIKDLDMIVPESANGDWGAYRIVRCWKSVSKYIAEVELVTAASNDLEAELAVIKYTKR